MRAHGRKRPAWTRGGCALALLALLGPAACTTDQSPPTGGATPSVRDGRTFLDPEPTTLTAPTGSDGATGTATSGSSGGSPGGSSGRETTTSAPRPLDRSATWLLVATEHLEVVRADGTDARRLVPDIDRDGRLREVIFGDWSPDGESAVFVEIDEVGSVVEPGHAVIWTVRSDGSGARKVEPCAPPCTVAITPSWSPDGNRIAYATGNYSASAELWTRSSIVVLDLRTGARQVVVRSTDGRVGFAFPRWSPDGTRLVVEVDRSVDASLNPTMASSSVATVSLDKGPDQKPTVISGSGWALMPDWDRRTGRIVWATNINPQSGAALGNANLVTADPSGTNARPVTRFAINDAFATTPSWTPNGEIVFNHCVDASTCWVAWIRPDGSGLRTPQKVQGFLPRVRP